MTRSSSSCSSQRLHGVLIGFESVDERNLAAMNKRFNTMRGGFESRWRTSAVTASACTALHLRLRRDTRETFDRHVRFAKDSGLYIAAFNHLTPFPGTPLYERLTREDGCVRALVAR
jgi:radical SAM superfamily enzyme YgiQ (UPF0313 family)